MRRVGLANLIAVKQAFNSRNRRFIELFYKHPPILIL